MILFKKVIFWLGLVPVVITFWGTVTASVYFFDDIQYIRSVVTRDAVVNHEVDMADIKQRLDRLED